MKAKLEDWRVEWTETVFTVMIGKLGVWLQCKESVGAVKPFDIQRHGGEHKIFTVLQHGQSVMVGVSL